MNKLPGRKHAAMIKIFLLAILFSSSLASYSLDTLSVCSPSGKICVEIWMEKNIHYQVRSNGKLILEPSEAELVLAGDQRFSPKNRITRHSIKKVDEIIISPVPEKRKKIRDYYNQLSINFQKYGAVEFRVYEDAVAYRFMTSFKDSIIVQNEIASFNFKENSNAYFPMVRKRGDQDIFHTSFEELYPLKQIDSIRPGEIAYNPVLVVQESNPRIGITESDLDDYPGMFLAGTGSSSLRGIFAPYPLEEKLAAGEFPQLIVTKRAAFIARTKGTRTFPWRVLIIAEEDRELPSNDIVYRLASPSRIGNASWVKPGKGTDEWIINVNLFNVPFKSGVNTASYKYYIDFAKRFGFDRIMMDAGWSDNTDLFKINPAINMDSILSYAKEKQVKVSLWTLAHTLNRQLDSALDRFEKWGVDYIMTDFIDRDDQKTVNFYHKIAKACADHHIMIMYHGAYPPKGFNRTYPNNVSREGLLGSEYNIWTDLVSPDHDVTLPYTRMLGGSFDYEPGLLNNATKNVFRPIGDMVMSQGTRCHQLAMFVVYDNPMQLFSGNPSQAWLEPSFTELMGSIPTTWTETKILDGKIGEYIITARKNEDNWFIGGMTNWTERNVIIHFDFLDEKVTYKASICQDGVNADRHASDYLLSSQRIKKNDSLKIHLAPGGGFLIRLLKQ